MKTRDELAAELRQTNPRFALALPAMAEQYLDRCMAEQERDAREPWRTLTFQPTTQGRGRNRWFRVHHGHLQVVDGYNEAWLRLYSKREGDTAPIILEFHGPADMRLLGKALLAAAEAMAGPAPASAGAYVDEEANPFDHQLAARAAKETERTNEAQ